MKKALLFLVCIPFLLSSQCTADDNDPCFDEEIATNSLETIYSCENTKYQMEIDLSNDFIVITDQQTFNDLVTGSCMPEIDFSTYHLLIGKQGLTSGNTSIHYSLSKDICKSDLWELTVNFNQNATAEAPNLTYHRLIPNTLNAENIMVTINIS